MSRDLEQTDKSEQMRPPIHIDLEAARERLELAQVHTDELIGGLAAIANGDIKDLLDDHGAFDYSKALRLNKTHLIKRLSSKTRYHANGDVTVEQEVHMYDRLRAYDQLRDIFGVRDEPRRNRAALIFQMAFELMGEAQSKGQPITFPEAIEHMRAFADKVGM